MILDSLNGGLKEALKAKDEPKASMIRMLISAIQNKEIEIRGKGAEISEQDILDVLKKELKKRKESAVLFEQGGRSDLAQKESTEAAYIETFLPPQLSESEVEKIVDGVLAGAGTVTQADFGRLMKEVMTKAEERTDGSVVSGILKGKLK